MKEEEYNSSIQPTYHETFSPMQSSNQSSSIQTVNRNRSSSNSTSISSPSSSDSLFGESPRSRSYFIDEEEGPSTSNYDRVERRRGENENENVGEGNELIHESNFYSPPSSYESNSKTYEKKDIESSLVGKGKEKEKTRDNEIVESEGEEVTFKIGGEMELDLLVSNVGKSKEVLRDPSTPDPSRFTSIDPSSTFITSSDTTFFPPSFPSIVGPSVIESPTSLLSTLQTNNLDHSLSQSTSRITRIKRSLSLVNAKPTLLFKKSSSSFSDSLTEVNSNSSILTTVCTTATPVLSRTGTPRRSGSFASLLVNTIPDSPAGSATSTKGTWKARSKEQLSKVLQPRMKGSHSTLPTPLGASNIQSNTISSQYLNVRLPSSTTSFEPSGFPFPSTRPGPYRSVSSPLLYQPSTYSQYHNTYGEFITAPSSPQPEEEIVEEKKKSSGFDELPGELKIRILGELLTSRDPENKLAFKGEWSGKGGGRRELIKIGRVSKSWLSLSLDSQLWSKLDYSFMGPGGIGIDGISRIINYSGNFIKSLDLRGCRDLIGTELVNEFKASLETNQSNSLALVDLNLSGCTSLVSSSLSQICNISPYLTQINLFSLSCVTGENIQILGMHAPSILSLNVSRCRNLDPAALLNISPRLQTLKISGLSSLLDSIFILLVLRFVHLEILDISFSPLITDQSFASITTPTTQNPFESITVTYPFERKRPRKPSIRKALLPWKHLNLSGCRAISPTTFTHLAHSLPNLTILEVSRMGRRLGSGIGNLDTFLTTLPKLRKLDLENGVELTDSVLIALVPSLNIKKIKGLGIIGGCPDLETLIISTCSTFTNSGILEVVRGCEKLKVLEADGTNIEEVTAKEFIKGLKIKLASCDSSGGILTILDNRTITEQLYKGLNRYRTRNGRRGYRTQSIQYHEVLNEYDDTLPVIRSAYTNDIVDKVDLAGRSVDEVGRQNNAVVVGWESLSSKCIIS